MNFSSFFFLVTGVAGSVTADPDHEIVPVIPVYSTYGSIFNTASKFEMDVVTHIIDPPMLVRVLFNTGSSQSWVEIGAIDPLPNHEREKFVPEPDTISGIVETEISHLRFLTPWFLRHRHAYTYRHGAGQIGAGLDSGFANHVGHFAVYPFHRTEDVEEDRINAPNGIRLVVEHRIVIGERDPSLPWIELPVIPNDVSKWLVAGTLQLPTGDTVEAQISLNTGVRGIVLPRPIYDSLIAYYALYGQETDVFEDSTTVKNFAGTDLFTIGVHLHGYEVPLDLVKGVAGVSGRAVAQISPHDHDIVEIGEAFFSTTIVHFDSVKKTVSIAPV